MLSLLLLLVEEESDRNKLEYIYGKYKNDAYRWAFEKTQNAMAAEEIVSEVFLMVADNIRIVKTDDEISLRAYLFKITKNKYNDRVRRDDRIVTVENFDHLADDFDLEKDIEDKEQEEIILEILKRMPSDHKYSLYFRYNESYSISDIAKMLGLSEGSVRKKLKEGVRYIIKILRKVEDNET